MNAISEIKRLPQNKSEMDSLLNTLKAELELQSNAKRAEVVTTLARISKIFEAIKAEGFIKETMQNLANEKYEVNGYIVEPHSTAKYDYSSCDVWKDLKRQISEREGLMKAAAKSVHPIYDNEGVEIPPATKTGSESFKLTQIK